MMKPILLISAAPQREDSNNFHKLSPKHHLANANMTDGKIYQKIFTYHLDTYNTVGLLRHVNRSATLTDHVQEVLLSDKGENGDSL